tara:strand:- start:208 stop:567 length:360 start_codon:yes stop_codon:yes gene_type:complete
MAGPFKMRGFSGFGNSSVKKTTDPPWSKKQTFTKKGVVDMATGKETTKFPKDNSFKFFKNTSKKLLKQVAKRAGLIGVGLTAYDAIRTIPKVVKATNQALKKEAKNELKGIKKTHVPKY